MNTRMDRFDIEDKEEWREWIDKIPTLRFPSDWEVKIIPPFSGALVRFLVVKGRKNISVYLDVFDNLGFFGGKPYWEIYPYDGDTYRCGINETDNLIAKIGEALDQ